MLKDSLLENTTTPAAAEWADIADSLVENCPTPVTVDDLFAETDSVDVVLDPTDAVRVETASGQQFVPAPWLSPRSSISVPTARTAIRFYRPGDAARYEVAPSAAMTTAERIEHSGVTASLDQAALDGIDRVPATLTLTRVRSRRDGRTLEVIAITL